MTEKLRAIHIDLVFSMWTRGYLEATVRQARRWGFNAVFLEIGDKFHFARHADIGAADAMTAEALASFADWCRDLDVDVVPLKQTFGHAEYVLRKPAYAHLRECPEHVDHYDPRSPEARALVRDLVDEIIDAIRPTKYFHVGGDETWSLGCSEMDKPEAERIGRGELYLGHMMAVFEHVRSRGLRPVAWADMVLSHPDILERVPKDVVMVDWNYWLTAERMDTILVWGGNKETGTNRFDVRWADFAELDMPQFDEHLAPFAVDEQTRVDETLRAHYCTDALLAAGFDVITAPANRCHGDIMGAPRRDLHMLNCFHEARKGAGSALGSLVTSWSTRRCHPEVTLPSTYAACEGAAGAAAADPTALSDSFTADHYGRVMPEFALATEQAGRSFKAGYSHDAAAYGARLAAGDDPLDEILATLDADAGGRAEAIAQMAEFKRGYDEALSAFASMKERADRKAGNLDFWIEGTRFNRLVADIVHAALEDRLTAAAPGLLAELRQLKEETRRLFSQSYTAEGVNFELETRYGFYEPWLASRAT